MPQVLAAQPGVALARVVDEGAMRAWAFENAAGVAAGVLVIIGLRRFITDSGIFQSILTVVSAILGQWAAFLVLTYWLRGGLVTVDALTHVLPWETGLTLLVYPLWAQVVTWGLGPRPSAEEEMGV